MFIIKYRGYIYTVECTLCNECTTIYQNIKKKNPKSFKIYFCDQESLAQYLVKDQIGIMRYLPTFLGHTLVVVVLQNDVTQKRLKNLEFLRAQSQTLIAKQ